MIQDPIDVFDLVPYAWYSVHDKKMRYSPDGKIGSYKVVVKGDVPYALVDGTPAAIFPIPMTKEDLEKNGFFVYKDRYFYRLEDFAFTKPDYDPLYQECDHPYGLPVCMKYWHELQRALIHSRRKDVVNLIII